MSSILIICCFVKYDSLFCESVLITFTVIAGMASNCIEPMSRFGIPVSRKLQT